MFSSKNLLSALVASIFLFLMLSLMSRINGLEDIFSLLLKYGWIALLGGFLWTFITTKFNTKE
jgi:hypothetical protein